MVNGIRLLKDTVVIIAISAIMIVVTKNFWICEAFVVKTLREDKICVIFKKLKTVGNKKKE